MSGLNRVHYSLSHHHTDADADSGTDTDIDMNPPPHPGFRTGVRWALCSHRPDAHLYYPP